MDFTELLKPQTTTDVGELDKILVELCGMIVDAQKKNPDYGLVAACIIDPKGRKVYAINIPDRDGKRIHAERAAVTQYQRHHGDVPPRSVIVTTLSPCSDDMDDRHGESCTDLINSLDVKFVYCGYKDPTQSHSHAYEHKKFAVKQTHNKKIIDLCKTFANQFLKEDRSTDENDLANIVAKFLPIAVKELGIKSLPPIKPVLRLSDVVEGEHSSFGMFDNASKTIYFAIEDRHPNDILRTLAHELVHHKQREENRLEPGDGETGSPEENEANAVAGIVMRKFADAYPSAFDRPAVQIDESYLGELFEPKSAFPLDWDMSFGPKEAHATAYDHEGRTISIEFVPIRDNVTEIEFTRGGSYDVTGRGDAPAVFSTVINAIKEYLQGYRPKILIFSAKGTSRFRLYQSLVSRFASQYGYQPFDINKLSADAKNKIAGSGTNVLVLRQMAS